MQNTRIVYDYDFSNKGSQRSFHRSQRREGKHGGRRSLVKSESLGPLRDQRAKYHLPQRESDGKE